MVLTNRYPHSSNSTVHISCIFIPHYSKFQIIPNSSERPRTYLWSFLTEVSHLLTTEYLVPFGATRQTPSRSLVVLLLSLQTLPPKTGTTRETARSSGLSRRAREATQNTSASCGAWAVWITKAVGVPAALPTTKGGVSSRRRVASESSLCRARATSRSLNSPLSRANPCQGEHGRGRSQKSESEVSTLCLILRLSLLTLPHLGSQGGELSS